ncbi:MAG: response regulator [Deltaproteobacteria bacterium]|nr:response regulator [Deltaproteobacteria bacterium]
MLVGQNTPFMETLYSRLASGDFMVDFVQSTPETSAMVHNKDIDVVIVNMNDLEADSLQLLNSIRKSGSFTEVITLSVQATIHWSIQCMKLGAFADLVIPFDNEDLVETIRKASARKHTREKEKKPLWRKFEDAMVAATFAEVGEIDAAREIINGRRIPKSTAKRGEKKNGEV